MSKRQPGNVGSGRGNLGGGTADKFGRTPAQQKHTAHGNGYLGQGTKSNTRKSIPADHGIIVRKKGAVRP